MSRRILTPNGGGGGAEIPVIAIANQPMFLDPFRAMLFAQMLQRNAWLELFVFSATWNTLLASAVGQQAIMNIDPNIDFIALQMNLTAYSAVGTIVQSPDYLMEVQEKSGNNNWCDAPIHVQNWTGQSRDAGARVYDLPFPRYIRGNNQVVFKLTNNTATAARVDLALVGIRATYLEVSREQLFGVPF